MAASTGTDITTLVRRRTNYTRSTYCNTNSISSMLRSHSLLYKKTPLTGSKAAAAALSSGDLVTLVRKLLIKLFLYLGATLLRLRLLYKKTSVAGSKIAASTGTDITTLVRRRTNYTRSTYYNTNSISSMLQSHGLLYKKTPLTGSKAAAAALSSGDLVTLVRKLLIKLFLYLRATLLRLRLLYKKTPLTGSKAAAASSPELLTMVGESSSNTSSVNENANSKNEFLRLRLLYKKTSVAGSPSSPELRTMVRRLKCIISRGLTRWDN